VLAAVGLYGVTAYTVAQRTNEIGIRMALGADRTKVVQLVRHGAFKRVGIGLVLGLPLALGAGRLISAQLYGRLQLGSAGADRGGECARHLGILRRHHAGHPRGHRFRQ
jgi:ABC-type antimicrobial peptide transport system permease subunit